MLKSLKAKLISCVISIAAVGCLIGFGVSSFAWFSNNKETEVSGLSVSTIVKTSVDIINDHYQVYSFDVEQDMAVEVDDDFTLAPYNMFVPARNAYNRKFVRMSLRYPNTVSGGTKLELTLTCDGDLFKEDQETELEVISNLIQFRFYDNYEGKIRDIKDGATVQEVYEDCVEVFDGLGDPTTFVTISQDTVADTTIAHKASKVVALEVDMPSLEDKTTQLISDFIMEIDYNEELIEYFKGHGAYNFDLSYFRDGVEIQFAEDIKEIHLAISGS